MSQKLRSRRGVTLAEIVIVIALAAILCVMVVSFSSLISARARANAANDAMRYDFMTVEAGAEGWLNVFSGSETPFTLSESDGELIANVEGDTDTYTLGYENGYLVGTVPEGNDVTIRTETVTSLTFSCLGNPEDKDYLVFCDVICQNPESGDEVKLTFCVNSHLGERRGVTVAKPQTSTP